MIRAAPRSAGIEGEVGGRAESFIIIRKGNVAIPVGRYGAGDKEYVWETSPPSTPQPTELFQGQAQKWEDLFLAFKSSRRSRSPACCLQQWKNSVVIKDMYARCDNILALHAVFPAWPPSPCCELRVYFHHTGLYFVSVEFEWSMFYHDLRGKITVSLNGVWRLWEERYCGGFFLNQEDLILTERSISEGYP